MSSKSSKLSFLDRYLTLWIFAAMALGILIGWGMPSLATTLSKISVGTTSIPIAIGLIVMMYPPFAKIDYKKLKSAFANKKAMLTAIIASWFVGPICMFILSVLFLRNYNLKGHNVHTI